MMRVRMGDENPRKKNEGVDNIRIGHSNVGRQGSTTQNNLMHKERESPVAQMRLVRWTHEKWWNKCRVA